MSKDTLVPPPSRTWRDIPQQVKPRSMSRGGRRRVAMGAWKAAAGAAALGLAAWGTWEVAAVVQGNAAALPPSAKPIPIRSQELATDGVLDKAWLVRTLALPKGATLMGLDLERLRARLLADAQVRSAELTRNFPDALAVRISERSPVARIRAQFAGDAPRTLLVSRDGFAFPGIGFDPGMLETLPWIDGVKLVRRGDAIVPIDGMDRVSNLLATAKFEAGNLYRTWHKVSLGRLALDGEIEVWTRDGLKIVFAANEGFGSNEYFLRQLARLNIVLESAGAHPARPLREVNLALGSQVPVAFGPMDAPAAAPDPQAAKPVFTVPAFPDFHSHP
jgi:POTRA domain, FtsQ-type